MSWFTSFFLWACVFPVLPIEYFLMRDEVKFKKNIVIGVTLPYEARSNEGIVHRLEQYTRELKRTFLVLLAGAVFGALIRTLSVAMLLWGVWLLLVIVLPNIPYARCNRDLKEIKKANGWSCQISDVVWVDTAVIPNEKWLSPWLFAPAVLLCLLPVVWDRDMVVVYVLDAMGALGCWVGYRYLYRNRAEIVDRNRDLTQVLSHVRRRNWGKIWLCCAYFLALINLSLWLVVGNPFFGMALMLLLSGLVLCAAVCIEFSTRRLQEKLTRESGKEWYVDEDDKWIWGLIYYNPNDSRTIINSRIGSNSTFNLARPGGKILAGIVALTLLALPFFGVFLDGIGSKPLDLQVSDTVLSASYGKSTYEIAVEDIVEVKLFDTLPERLTRVGGTGTETLLKGKFRSPEYGSMTLCLDPQCPPFLLIKTESGQCFLFGTRTRETTEQVFAKLTQ